MIKPLLKKNGLDLDLCKNYRPVSNLPYVSKLLERVVAKQLVSLVDRHDLPDKFQAAYLPGHSCETALLRVLGDVLRSADGDDLVLLYPCASALHLTPSTGTPLTRLRDEVGISGAAHQWFCSYLTDRTQHVTVNQASSADKPDMWCSSWLRARPHPLLSQHYSTWQNHTHREARYMPEAFCRRH